MVGKVQIVWMEASPGDWNSWGHTIAFNTRILVFLV